MKEKDSIRQEGLTGLNSLERESLDPKFKQAWNAETEGKFFLASRFYEEAGFIEDAYRCSKLDPYSKFKADQLAVKYGIVGHEFSDFQAPGLPMEEGSRVALESRLQPGASAEKIGFQGFKAKTVLDVGCADGRYFPIFKNLEALEVFGVDPEPQDGIEVHLNKDHIFTSLVEDIDLDFFRGKFDIITLFNSAIPYDSWEKVAHHLYELLSENGQVVITFAEDERLEAALPILKKYFVSHNAKLWKPELKHYPNKNLVILSKKPKILIET